MLKEIQNLNRTICVSSELWISNKVKSIEHIIDLCVSDFADWSHKIIRLSKTDLVSSCDNNCVSPLFLVVSFLLLNLDGDFLISILVSEPEGTPG